ncbi:hypothetical protein ACVRZR_05775 [Streptococcus entericus]|uniref:hypothetical protein n=1 Tax=Streptococcus entericus TaxID=155680 RepID=UPI00036ABCFE|nr:hypothetical protein [Streptococcus entericus]
MTKPHFPLLCYLLSFLLPWLQVYDFLTLGGPFSEEERDRVFAGWEIALRYWYVFLAFLVLLGLADYLKRRFLLLVASIVFVILLLWVVTFGDLLNVTPLDYLALFRYYSFSYIKVGYFIHALAGGFLLRRLYQSI